MGQNPPPSTTLGCLLSPGADMVRGFGRMPTQGFRKQGQRAICGVGPCSGAVAARTYTELSIARLGPRRSDNPNAIRSPDRSFLEWSGQPSHGVPPITPWRSGANTKVEGGFAGDLPYMSAVRRFIRRTDPTCDSEGIQRRPHADRGAVWKRASVRDTFILYGQRQCPIPRSGNLVAPVIENDGNF